MILAEQPTRIGTGEGSVQHGELVQQLRRIRFEEVDRPLDEPADAPVTLRPSEAGPVEHFDAGTQPFQQLVDAHRSCPRRGDLDRQRQSVEVPTDPHDRVEIVRSDHDAGVTCPGPDARHGRRRGSARIALSRPRQGSESADRLPRHVQGCSAGRQDRRRLAGVEQGGDDRCGRVDHVLTVVGDHQRRLVDR